MLRIGVFIICLMGAVDLRAQEPQPPQPPPQEKPAAKPEAPIEFEEEVIVTAARTGGRIDEQPTRVEVLTREEVEEKMLMTPGDIVMMLNEMGGMRVQATSPSLGAASVRIQGMKGRYTRVLFDGLPLAGQQVGGLGLLQIPPMDLGQVEVIKGVASALYGSGSMAGVINLLSRRPQDQPVRELLFNQSTLGATDSVAFLSRKFSGHWSGSLLASGHRQSMSDVDDDGWADLAGYTRGVVRPRVFWDDGSGASGWATVGVTAESRDGGVVPDSSLRSRLDHPESIDTRRIDFGGAYQFIASNQVVVTSRVAATLQRHEHLFGPVLERDRHTNVFAEAALRGAIGRHTWAGGVAFERESFDPLDVPRFAYYHRVPGVFAQDDIRWSDWLTVSASARLDLHHLYGTFFSPRLSALIRKNGWTSRVSAGRGFFASTPLTEETEAAGLSRLSIPRPLEPETGKSMSIDVTRMVGPASITATFFASSVAHAIEVARESTYELGNAVRPTTNIGIELLGAMRRPPFALTGTYAFVGSREERGGIRVESALTPRHSAGLVGIWEREGVGRVGVEYYLTGAQRLDVNPYRDRSEAYAILGVLAERPIGRYKLFINGENLTNVRQTKFDPLLRPTQAVDGRWTVDAWAPLDGRAINAGVRLNW